MLNLSLSFPECNLAEFISGSSSERIPFVYLPLSGQLVYPRYQLLLCIVVGTCVLYVLLQCVLSVLLQCGEHICSFFLIQCNKNIHSICPHLMWWNNFFPSFYVMKTCVSYVLLQYGGNTCSFYPPRMWFEKILFQFSFPSV